MTTKLSLGTTSHSHRCVICEAEIPCDNPEDAQDCLVSALTCGNCDDISQTLPSTGSGDYEPDDGFESKDSDANDVSRDQDLADSFEDLLQGDYHRIEDYDAVDSFTSILESDNRVNEDWVPDPQTRPERPTAPPVRMTTKSKKRRGKR